MLSINDEIEVTCEYVALDGKGVIKNPDGVIYVPFLLDGEKALIKINSIKGRNIYGSIVNLISSSSYRSSKNLCNVFDRCGGCNLLHMNYERSILFKKESLRQLFKKNNIEIIKMNNPFNYRNKVISSFSLKKDKIVNGLYIEGSHNIVNTSNCLIQNKIANKILLDIKDIMIKQHILPFDEKYGNGILRHVMIRVSEKEVMVVLIVSDEIFNGRNNFVHELVNRNKNITTIVQNVNKRNTSIVLGDKERVLYGKGFIIDSINDILFKISSKSFYQVNSIQMKELYNLAIEKANLSKNDTVLDAYCGIGTITLLASKYCKKIIGVEINKQAVNDALENSRLNKISNASFYCEDATRFMLNCSTKIDVLFLDPTRDGVTKEFINSVIKLKPKKIVYISCNPLTQKRDIDMLSSVYDVKFVGGIDMFPYTLHVESVALLTLKDIISK